ncbi:MAG TPA: FG-GAP-like repeat-containing protein [Leptospiraceae bacterium]|nr:FG-GAP-like repeat-containing protein [Leptospiraceae bacterium]HRG77289.1 FG-GAP-like repeat-containing protein [Leptospiraceae bacterium]
MRKIKQQMKKIGLLALTLIGLCNFMWLHHDKPRWHTTIPQMAVVRYQMNPNFLPKNGLTQAQQLSAIQRAANIWFDQGLSNFRFEFNGQTTNGTVQPVAGLSCDQRLALNKTVFSTNFADPDFPLGIAARTYSYWCGGYSDGSQRYMHFDMRFNDKDYVWTEQMLQEVATHEFGHALGLDHCATNETLQACAANRPGTDPVAGMMMNKFYIPGTNKLHPDDITGIRALYGVRGAVPFAGNLIAIKKSVTGSNSTEVHIVRGTANYQEYSLETGTILHETGAEFEFAVWDMNRDGIMDIVGIKKAVTGTNSTEVHVLNGATNFQTYLLQTGTALHETRSDANWKFAVWDYDGNGSMDLVAIVKHGGSGNTEVHVLNGSDNFKTFLLSTVTALEANADSYDFSVWDYNNDGKMDLVAVKKNMTGAGRTEVHILDGASNFSTFRLHAVTPIEENTSNYEFIPTYYPVRGSAMNIVAVKKFNTGSLSTELHVLNGATDFGTYIVNSATILVETGSNFDMDFWL